jgi:hypothetical protein
VARHLYFVGGQSFEFCHYAEMASRFLKGQGLTTRIFMPSELAYLKAAGHSVHEAGPTAIRFPGFVLWSALGMAVGGRNDFGMCLGNGMAHAVWVAFIYKGGKGIIGEKPAFWSAVTWMLNPVMLAGYDLLGVSDILFGALVFGFNVLWIKELGQAGWRKPRYYFLLGFLAAAMLWARQSFLILLPVYAAGLGFKESRLRISTCFYFLAGVLLGFLPLAFYYLRTLGRLSPLSAWELAASNVTGPTPWLEFRIYPLRELIAPAQIPILFRKFSVNLFLFLKEIPRLWALFPFLPFAFAGLFYLDRSSQKIWAWLGLLFVTQLIVFSFLRFESLGFLNGRYYLWIGPYVLLLSWTFLEKWSHRRWGLFFLFTVPLITAILWTRMYRRIERPGFSALGKNVSDWPEFSYLRENSKPEDHVLTNIPAQVGWYAQRPAVNVPIHISDFQPLNDLWKVDWILLTNRRPGEINLFREWVIAVNQNKLAELGPDFRVEKSFDSSLLLRRIK